MSKDKSITDYYRYRAGEYEQIYYRKVPERRQEIDDHCRYLEKLAKNKTVLDLACGTGYWTKVLAKSAKELVASDIVLEMITQARLKEFSIPVEFVVADLHRPPFIANTFDLVTLGFWMSHEPRQNYTDMFRAIKSPLKEDGLIWMIDNNPPAEGPRIDSVRNDEFGNNFKKRLLSNGDEFVILKNYFSKENLVEILSSTFEIKELIHQPYYWSALLKPK
jgi:ubiquinone/menaquinone biosynthesis C-methylase UbiE